MYAQLWFWFALGAAASWGLQYVWTERLVKIMSLPALLAISSAAGLVFYGSIWLFAKNTSPAADFQSLSRVGAWPLLMGVIALNLVANLCILSSLKGSNATLSAMVEICYPLFTLVFAWLLYRESQVDMPIAVGGSLVLAGILVIHLFSR